MSPSWLLTVALCVALSAYAALALAIIVTALVERLPTKVLTPAEPDDPERRRLDPPESDGGSFPSPDFNPYASPGTIPYAETQIRAASRLAFSEPGLFKPFMGGIYKTYHVLMVSRSRRILAIVRWGTTARIRNERTALYSELDDGRYLVTSDWFIGDRNPGFQDDLVFPHASFEQLVDRHEARLGASGRNVRLLSAEDPLSEHEALHERRARFLVERGEAYWVDPEQSAIRSTLKGALKTYIRTLSHKHVDQSLSGGAWRK